MQFSAAQVSTSPTGRIFPTKSANGPLFIGQHPHTGVSSSGLSRVSESVPSPMTVQQQLISLQQQIAALGATTGSLTGMQSGGAPFYPVTSFPNNSSQTYGSGAFGNSPTILTSEKMNGDNYFSWS